ncbi:MAG: aldo/keto reductase [Spirochaetaceae bacterium]|nr:aldo/keto reductase [Spirochaetaceae bacterium]
MEQERAAAAARPARATLPRRRLGRTGLEVSVLGLGGAFLGAARDRDNPAAERAEIASATVRAAVEFGINYIDTSPFYQDEVAERSLGVALSGLSPEQRDGLYVSTKVGTRSGMVGQYDGASVRRSLAISREALGRDYLDIVFVHDPTSAEHMDQVLAVGGAAEAIEDLKAAGMVGALGLGVGNHQWHRRCIEDGRFDVVLLPYDYSPVRDSARSLIELARAHDVGVVSASPYLRGLLAGPHPADQARYRVQEPQDVQRAAAVYGWCRERGVDVGALAMQFSLRNTGIGSTLVGSRDAAEIAVSFRHATMDLPDGIWAEFEAAAARFPAAAPGGEAGVVI